MVCDVVRVQLSAYLDGELTPQDKALVEKHLTACSECRKHLGLLQVISKAVRDIPREQPSQRLRQALLTWVIQESIPLVIETWVEERSMENPSYHWRDRYQIATHSVPSVLSSSSQDSIPVHEDIQTFWHRDRIGSSIDFISSVTTA